ncbi:hypothetical protein MAH2_29960 [Sessilibacter sp. MAH2]
MVYSSAENNADFSWNKMLSDFSSGKDVDPILHALENKTFAKYDIDVNGTARQLRIVLDGFIRDLEQEVGISANTSKVNFFALSSLDEQSLISLRPSFEKLQAYDLLFSRKLIESRSVVNKSGSNLINARFESGLLHYESTIREFLFSLDTVYGAIDSRVENANWLESFWQDSNKVINLIEVVDQLRKLSSLDESKVDILGESIAYSSEPIFVLNIDSRESIIPSYELSNPISPLAEDRQETELVDFGSIIRNKAEELDHDPIRIFEFVRNNIVPEFYYGSMKGAELTLMQGSGNDADQSALLIALLRASGVASRFVEGVIELSLNELKQQVGIVRDDEVLNALRSAGYPFEVQIRGGTVHAIRLNYVWVSAYLPYSNYRGATVDNTGQQWLALFPSLKSVSVNNNTSLLTNLGVDLDNLRSEFLQTVNTESIVDEIRALTTSYLNENGLGIYQDNLRSLVIDSVKFDYLPNSLPIPVIKVTSESSRLSDEKIHKINFIVYADDVGVSQSLNVTLPLAQLASQRVTLSYIPSTVDEQKIVQQFGGLAYTPSFLVSLTPQLKINGLVVATGNSSVASGQSHRSELTLIAPFGSRNLEKNLISGGYHAFGISAQRTLINAAILGAESSGDTEFLAARVLSQIALRYSRDWYDAEQELANLSGLKVIRPWPSIAIASNDIVPELLFGQVQELGWRGVNLDAIFRHASVVQSVEDNSISEVQWRSLSGLHGSYLEHRTFEHLFQVPSISADKGLAIALGLGLELIELTQANLSTEISRLNHPDEVIDQIQTWIGQGFNVVTTESEFTYKDWFGSVWVVTSQLTGESGYYITRGLAGGSSASLSWPAEPGFALQQPYGNPPNLNPFAGAFVELLPDSSLQVATVGEVAENPLRIRVYDDRKNPVVGAEVIFSVVLNSDGTLQSEPDTNGGEITELSSFTNEFGVAQVYYRAGLTTSHNELFLRLNPNDPRATKLGLSYVDVAFVIDNEGRSISAPFTLELFNKPGEAVNFASFGGERSGANGHLAGPETVTVVDEFDNPVANVPVVFSIGSAFSGADSVPNNSQIYGGDICHEFPVQLSSGCQEELPFLDYTNGFGNAGFFPILGENASAFDFNIAIGNETPFSVTYSADRSFRFFRPGPQAAARVGTEFPAIYQFVDYQHENRSTPLNLTFSTESGSTVPVQVTSPGVYELGAIATLSSPGIDELRVSGNNVSETDSIYAVEITLEPLENPVELSPLGQTLNHTPVKFLFSPIEYGTSNSHIFSQVLEVFENGERRYVFQIGRNERSVVIPKGTQFNVEDNYEYQLVVNGSFFSEVRSDKVALEFLQPIVVNIESANDVPPELEGEWFPLSFAQGVYNTNLSAYLDIDIQNNFFCGSAAEIYFNLTQDAHVNIVLNGGLLNDEVVTDENLTEGGQLVDFPTSNLIPGTYQYTLTATSLATGDVEVYNGVYQYRVTWRDSLPLGHANFENVDLFDGHLAFSSEDFSIPGLGPDLRFVRSYTSNSDEPSPMGRGWSHNYDSFIQDVGCGAFTVVGGDGGGVRFFVDAAEPTGFRASLGYHSSLVRDENGEFDFYAKDGTRYHYRNLGYSDYQWHLEFITDTNGNTTSLAYNPAGLTPELRLVEDYAGRRLEFEYDYDTGVGAIKRRSEGRLITAVNFVGTENTDLNFSVNFNHDDLGRLTQVRGPVRDETFTYLISDAIPPITADETIIFAGDDYTLRNAMRSVERPEGNFTFNWEIFELQNPNSNSSPIEVGAVDSMSGRWGGEVDFNYLSTRATAQQTYVSEVLEPRTEGRRATVTYTMNNYGAPINIEGPTGTQQMRWLTDDILMEYSIDESGVRTDYVYDQFGNVIEQTVAGFEPIVSEYFQNFLDFRFNKTLLKSRTDRNGHKTDYRYDSRGNLLEISYPVFPYTENFVIRSDGLIETFWYDNRGFLLGQKDRAGNVSTFVPNSRGYLQTMIDPFGSRSSYEWDDYGYKIKEVDEEGSTFEFVNNLQGFLLESTNAFGTITREYNYFGSIILEQDADGRVHAREYTINDQLIFERRNNGETRTLEYDEAGNLISETDYRGFETNYRYDDRNYQVEVAYPLTPIYDSGSDTSVDQIVRMARTFLPTGQIESETIVDSGQTTRFTYDNLYRQITATVAADSDVERVTTYIYDQDDMVQEIDAQGKVMEYGYDALHQRRTMTETAIGGLSRTMGYDYDANSNMSLMTDYRGNQTRRRYDGLNRLVQEVDRTNGSRLRTYFKNSLLESQSDALNNVTFYTYDNANRQTGMRDPRNFETFYTYFPSGLKQTESWPNGNTIEYRYDNNARVVNVTDIVGVVSTITYDADDRVLTITDGEGFISENVYDSWGRQIEQRLPYQDLGDGYSQQILRMGYDLRGNVAFQQDANGGSSLSEYDLQNRLVRLTDRGGFVSSTIYDIVGNVLSQTDGRGNTTEWQYDGLYRRTLQRDPIAGSDGSGSRDTSFEYDLNDNLISTTDKRGFVTGYTFDGENRPLITTRIGIPILENEYDVQGNITFTTDANDNITAYQYDERNQLITESRPLAAISNYEYDSMGDRILVVDPEGRNFPSEYDERRRMIESSNDLNETTRYTYLLNNQRLTQQLPEGNTWSYGYDSANRLAEIEAPVSIGGVTKYEYDQNNNLLSQTDAENSTSRFTYDARDLRTSMTYPDGAVMTYDDYDGNGNLTQATDARGIIMGYAYDELNRETSRTFTNTSAVEDDIVQVDSLYDANNNMVAQTESYRVRANRSSSYVYDDFDRLIRKTDTHNKTVNFSYDLNGNRIRITDPDGIITNYVYDELNRVQSVRTLQGVTQYTYDRDSRMNRVQYPNNTEANYTYDRVGRTSTIRNLQNSAVVSSYEYSYDQNSNRTQQIEVNGGLAEVTTYQYDDFDRLTNVVYPDSTVAYDYDLVYNRLGERVVDNADTTLKDWDYQYNERHQLTNILDQLDTNQNITYTFDPNGNQTSKTQAGVTTDFLFDARDHIRQVLVGGSSVGQFLYDPHGLRIEKIGDRGVERYTYDDLSVLLQYNGDNNTVAKFDWGPDRLLSLNHITEGPQFYLTDVLGSVVNLTHNDGSIQARYQYDAWGNRRNQVGDSWNRFAFTGHEEDTETGLLYAKARFYDPDTGRFLSQDAYEGDINTPPSLHKYLYAYQNPTVYVDPDGNQTITTAPGPLAPLGVGVQIYESSETATEAIASNVTGIDFSDNRANLINNLLNHFSISGAIDGFNNVVGKIRPHEVAAPTLNTNVSSSASSKYWGASDPEMHIKRLIEGQKRVLSLRTEAGLDTSVELQELKELEFRANRLISTESESSSTTYANPIIDRNEIPNIPGLEAPGLIDSSTFTPNQSITNGIVSGTPGLDAVDQQLTQTARPDQSGLLGDGILLSEEGDVTKSGLREADNIANGPKLAKQLTNESARSPFNASGGLTEGTIKNSTKIIDSSQIKNSAIPKGYSKYTTETFQSPSGNFQTHFYKNDKTGEVFYGQDYKAIFNSKSGG